MAEQETLEQILHDGYASVQAETEARQQCWGFQGPFQQLLEVEIFRQLGWMSGLALSEEGSQLLQHPELSTALEQGLGQLDQQCGQQVQQPVWHVPEQDLQFRADWQIMAVSGMFATAE